MGDLLNARYMNLATMRRNGVQVNTPVWFAESDNKYFVFSAKDTGKVKRIRNSAKSRIAPCDIKGKLTGEWIDAECHFASQEEDILAYQLLQQKYGWQMSLTNFFSRLTGKIDNRVVLVITKAPRIDI